MKVPTAADVHFFRRMRDAYGSLIESTTGPAIQAFMMKDDGATALDFVFEMSGGQEVQPNDRKRFLQMYFEGQGWIVTNVEEAQDSPKVAVTIALPRN